MKKLWSTNKADIEFSHWIRDRDKGKCFFCGKQGSQNSHFWGRGASSVRYDPENCDYSCGGCHMRVEGNKQGRYRDMKIAQLGQDKYLMLMLKAHKTMKRDAAIIELMTLLR